MQNGFPYLDILIFGVIAIFLIFRLKNILGTKTGLEDNNLNESALWALDLFRIKLQIPLLSSRIKIFSLRTILIFQSIKIYLNIFRKYQYYYDCGMRNANDIVISSPKKCRLL